MHSNFQIGRGKLLNLALSHRWSLGLGELVDEEIHLLLQIEDRILEIGDLVLQFGLPHLH